MKSAWPGVSIRFMVWGMDESLWPGLVSTGLGGDLRSCGGEGGQLNVMAADWIVIPLARSAGRKSVTVDPSSTSPIRLVWPE